VSALLTPHTLALLTSVSVSTTTMSTFQRMLNCNRNDRREGFRGDRGGGRFEDRSRNDDRNDRDRGRFDSRDKGIEDCFTFVLCYLFKTLEILTREMVNMC